MTTTLTPMQRALAAKMKGASTEGASTEGVERLGEASRRTQTALPQELPQQAPLQTALPPVPNATAPATQAPTAPAPSLNAAPHVLAALAKLKAQSAPQPVATSASTEPQQAPPPASSRNAFLAAMAQKILAKRAAENPASTMLAQALQTQAAQQAKHGTGGIEWNAAQWEAVELGNKNESFVLVGAAGTGKTTCVRQIITDKIQAFLAAGGRAENCTVRCVAFTNRAVKNLIKSCKGIADIRIQGVALSSCSTIHKLLKFAPVYYDYETPDGNIGRTMRFEPTFRASLPLNTLELVVVDEASMVDLPLWKKLLEATPSAHFIFIGDLNQLKPVFGLSVLGYKLLEHPVVELTEVYRQALESPILNFQHKYSLKGIPPSDTSLQAITESSGGKLVFQALTKERPPAEQARVLAQAMQKFYAEGKYKPHEDIILLPHGKDGTFGSHLVNQWIAQWLGEERGARVHEILCGMSKKYLAVGDYVVYNKEEYFVEGIQPNRLYYGKQPQEAATNLMRTGFYKHKPSTKPVELDDFDTLLELAQAEDGSERKLAASHSVTLVLAQGAQSLDAAMKLAQAEDIVDVNTKGELNEIAFGYALTVHKSQGSEWRKVFFAATRHHAAQLNRELVYTAMTRAREELHVWYSASNTPSGVSNTIASAIMRPSIAGRNWREKCKHFADRVEEYKAFMAEPTEYYIG